MIRTTSMSVLSAVTLVVSLSIAALALVAGSPALAQTRPNPAGLTAEMIAPCNDWLAFRPERPGRPIPAGLSNLDFALSVPPYGLAGGPYNIASVRSHLAEQENIVSIMERRDEAGMRRVIGWSFSGAAYWSRLANDEQFLCMLYVRRKQLTGEAFSRPIPTPASLGFPGQAARP